TPLDGASAASLSSSFQTYVANSHWSAPVFSIKRVSTRRYVPAPSFWNENSFQNFVPTGNTQRSISELSIAEPGGRKIQRDLAAPSDHSGYCGSKKSFTGSICLRRMSE